MSARRQNNMVISYKIPFGYKRSKSDPSKMIEVPYQQKIIKEIIRRQKRGERIYHIAKLMAKRKIKTVYGGKWQAKTIDAIIKRWQKLNA